MPDIVVKPTAGQPKVTVTVDDTSNTTIAQLKKLLAADLGCPESQQRLIYKGQILKDEKTINDYGIVHEHVVHFVKARAPTDAPRSGPPAPSSAASTRDAAMGIPGGGVAGSVGMNAAIQQAMSNPMMQQMMSNPEIMRSLMQANPQMRQLMESNPEIAHLMNDPAMLRQSMQIASNPELMQQQLRQQDQALNNIQSHPEGFNALRNMYQSMQASSEPDATTASESSAAAAADNPFAALFAAEGASTAGRSIAQPEPPTSGAPNSVPMPNPWAPPPPTAPPSTAAGLGVLPDFGGGAGGSAMQQQMMSMMEQPHIRGAVQSLMAQPGMMEQMIQANPQLRSMAESDPGLRSMLNNPEAMRQMLQPQNMRAMADIQRAMAGGTGGAGPPPGSLPGNIDFSQMMAGMGGSGLGGVPPPPQVTDPETTYASQIQQLVDMGFYDRDANVRALQASGGNVNAAVERLLA